MSDEHGIVAQIFLEFDRLGLNLDDSPYSGMAGNEGAPQAFLARLRELRPGVTWWDVFPDLPEHWIPGRPETWTRRYRPLGPYDYQELPTGSVAHIDWPKDTDRSRLDAFMVQARAAGWPVYGAGFIVVTNPNWPSLDALVVMERGTPDEVFDEFRLWIDAHTDASFAACPRRGDETYFTG